MAQHTHGKDCPHCKENREKFKEKLKEFIENDSENGIIFTANETKDRKGMELIAMVSGDPEILIEAMSAAMKRDGKLHYIITGAMAAFLARGVVGGLDAMFKKFEQHQKDKNPSKGPFDFDKPGQA